MLKLFGALTNAQTMKITYATTYDASDVHHWSGLGYHIAKALQRQEFELNFIGPLACPKMLWPAFKAKGLLYNRILGKRYHRGHDAVMAHYYARRIDEQLRKNPQTDLVFSPGAVPIAFLQSDRPTAYWHDATHANLFDFYPEYTDMCDRIIRDGHRIEQTAIDRASAVIFSSDWAAQSALRDYGADPSKVHVVPFGANLENPPSAKFICEAVRARPRQICKLLFIGVDWIRKGGATALRVAEKLNRIGLPAELTIVGCNPFEERTQPDYVRCEGFLSKRSLPDCRRMEQLLAESHFLIVPSLAECFGLVYCEANAFGVPCLARSVGGVPTIIKNGLNGYLFDPDDSATAYVQVIERLFQQYNQYLDLAFSSANEFNRRLNWDVAGKRAREILVNAVRAPRRPGSRTTYSPHRLPRKKVSKRTISPN